MEHVRNCFWYFLKLHLKIRYSFKTNGKGEAISENCGGGGRGEWSPQLLAPTTKKWQFALAIQKLQLE